MEMTTILGILVLLVGAAVGWFLNAKYGKGATSGAPLDWAKLGRELGMYVIAIIVIVATFWVLKQVLGVEIPAGNRDVVMMIVGVLVAKFGTIVDFFYGSSKGSADKTDAMAAKAPDA